MRALTVSALLAALAAPGAGLAAGPPSVDDAIESGDRSTRDGAIVISVEGYDQLPQATFAKADAEAWKDWLIETRGVRESRIYTLSDPSYRDLYRYIRKAAYRVRSRGTLWVIFAGHGAMTATEGGERTLLPKEASAEELGQGGMTLSEAARHLRRTRRARRIVFVLDAAFDGRGRDGRDLVPGVRFEVPELEPITDNPALVVWSAASGDAPVDAWNAAGHGTFTWTALGALRGWADGELDGQPDGKVTLAEAHAYTTWTGRQLGKPLAPALFGDDSHRDFAAVTGSWLEAGPTPDELWALSEERRRRAYDDMETLLRAEAAAFWSATLDSARQGGPEGRASLEAFVDVFADRELTLSWTVALPEVREARQLLARYDDAMATPAAPAGQPQAQPSATAEAAALQQVEEVAQAVDDASCDDLVTLEPDAMMGKLSPGQVSCLDMRVRTDRLQTDREKASKVLIVNAQAAGDQIRWEILVERHLREISRADPALVMQYAVHLFRTDPIDNGEDAIHWADVALENKSEWEAAQYIKNVNALYRVRAESAYKLWIDADRAYRANPGEETEWAAEEYRGWTKDYSREWLDYLRAAGQPHDLALQICTSAAGTADFCRAR